MNVENQSGKASVYAVFSAKKTVLYLICGVLIGLGAVLPGISGGVMCVIFGIYKPIMDFLSNPIKTLKKQADIIIPSVIGTVIGFLAVSKILGFLLERYPDQSVFVFVGLIFGMLPSLFREAGEKGRSKGSFIGLAVAFIIILSLLIGLNLFSFTVVPGIGWYIFCGFCIALSVIIPGMSFSTLLMPLGLYTPLVTGIGNFDFAVLLPAAIGAVVTVILLAKAASALMDRYYSIAFHSIIGIVIAATLVIIPFGAFTAGVAECITSIICLVAGGVVSLLMGKLDVIKN